MKHSYLGHRNAGTTHVVHKAIKSSLASISRTESAVSTVVLYTSRDQTDIVNAVYLLGAFLSLHLGATPEQAWKPFEALDGMLLPYRDATWVKSTFDLRLLDCWAGLRQAVSCGFYNFDSFDQVRLRSVDSAPELAPLQRMTCC